MARRPPFAVTIPFRELREQRTQRLLTQRAVADSLISVAALQGSPLRNTAGVEIGRVVDLVARWEGAHYPLITGLVARVGRRRVFVPMSQLASFDRDGVDLFSARIDLRDFVRRPDEVALMADVVDHQLIDVDGVRVVRAADLYVARALGALRLVGVDVGFPTLLRRLGPARWRRRAIPDRVVDWVAIQPFGTADGRVRLRRTHQALRRLRPGELADLLEELGRSERQELLDTLEPPAAADALEEMEERELAVLLREVAADRAVALLGEMEPDEAADALRALGDDEVDALLAVMPHEGAARLRSILGYPADTAGGLMTTRLVTVRPSDTVAEVQDALRAERDHRADVDAVVLVDEHGRLIDDITVFEVLVGAAEATMGSLAAPPWPVTIRPTAEVNAVVEAFTEARGSSVIVVDADGRPLGRILADDLVDALTRTRERRRWMA
ncbi:MAG: CBS domain-containing protein [Acidimicrobiia bacterium]